MGACVKKPLRARRGATIRATSAETSRANEKNHLPKAVESSSCQGRRRQGYGHDARPRLVWRVPRVIEWSKRNWWYVAGEASQIRRSGAHNDGRQDPVFRGVFVRQGQRVLDLFCDERPFLPVNTKAGVKLLNKQHAVEIDLMSLEEMLENRDLFPDVDFDYLRSNNW